MRTKIIFVNDGPGLLLGSMWDDYSYIEDASDDVMVVTLRMIIERITLDWFKQLVMATGITKNKWQEEVSII